MQKRYDMKHFSAVKNNAVIIHLLDKQTAISIINIRA